MAQSWSRLPPEQAAALRSLSAFVGPFSLADAAAVLDRPALAVVGRLHDRSLVHRQPYPDGTVGFRLLALVRADASRRLDADPTERDAVHRRHADHVNARARALDPLYRSDLVAYRAGATRLRGDLLAITRRLGRTDPLRAAEAVRHLGLLSLIAGDNTATLARARAVLPLLDTSELRGDLEFQEERALLRLGRFREVEALVRARLPGLWSRSPARAVARECQLALQFIARDRPREALALLAGTRERARVQGTVPAEQRGMMLGYTGKAHYALGELDAAEPALAEAVELLRSVGRHSSADWFEEALSVADWMRGRVDAAIERHRRLLAQAEAADVGAQIAERSAYLAAMLLERGDLDEARSLLECAERLAEAHPIYQGVVHLWRGDLALRADDPAEARVRWRTSAARFATFGQGWAAAAEARILALDDDEEGFDRLVTACDPLVRQEVVAVRAGHATHADNGFARLGARVGWLIRRRRPRRAGHAT